MASNIYVTKEDYEASRNFLIQFLRDSGFEGSLEDGTALHDVVIKAFALMYTLFKRQTQKVSAYLSLEQAVQMKDYLGDDYHAAVDSILSNWFVQRKDGTKTTGSVRLWFTRPLEFLHVKEDQVLATIDGVRFRIAEEKGYTEADFAGVMNTVNNVTEYYIDVPVISVENSDVSPTYNSTVSVYARNIYFIRAQIIEDFLPGTTIESTEDLIRRTKKVITTRELITERAINTVLMDSFENLWNVYVAGYGDPEQMRDVKSFEGVVVHVGNKADIYCTAPYVNGVAELTVDSEGNINLKDISDSPVVSFINSIKKDIGGTLTNVSYVFNSCDEVTFNSANQNWSINVVEAQHGEKVQVNYITNTVVKDVTAFITNSENRVACYDPLVKAKFLIKLTFNVKLTVKNTVDQDSVKLKTVAAIIDYVDRIAKYEEVYKESELISYVHILVPEIYAIEVPLDVVYTTFDPQANSIRSGDIPDYLEASMIGVVSKQFSDKTMQLYTDETAINVTIEKVVS